jgi:hypothetical protein
MIAIIVGITTLVVLITLGALLYAVAATSLAAAGEDQLRARATDMKTGLAFAPVLPIGPIGGGIVDVGSAPGIVFGGPTSGTIAVVWGPSTGAGIDVPAISIGAVALPEGNGLEQARSGIETVTTTDWTARPSGSVPSRSPGRRSSSGGGRPDS